MSEIKIKVCSKCKQEKSLTEFCKNKQNHDRPTSWCKQCRREAVRNFSKTPSGIYSQSKGSCLNRGRKPFKISKEDYIEWYKSQPRICEYCGLPESEIKNIKDKFLKPTKRLTVDCKDNDLGYVKGNLVLACRRCNSLKLDFFSFEEMRYVGEHFVRPKWEKQLGHSL